MTTQEPTTEAGRALLRYSKGLPNAFITPKWLDAILAIEQEARDAALRDAAERVRALNPRSRLKHKADDPTSSFDPLIRETEVLEALR